jgi:hypothetical protein
MTIPVVCLFRYGWLQNYPEIYILFMADSSAASSNKDAEDRRARTSLAVMLYAFIHCWLLAC